MKRVDFSFVLTAMLFCACSTNVPKSEITAEMAYEGVSNYCHSTYDWNIMSRATMRQFFIDYFDARSNEQYHNPRTGLRTYILSFTEGSTRLELMQRTEQREPSSSLEWPSRDGRRQSQVTE